MNAYEEYYLNQVGGRVDVVYAGAPYQRGHGLGSFMARLFRQALPLITKGFKAVGKEALHAGLRVVNDVENKTPFRDALSNRFKESKANLKRKAVEKLDDLMKGSGYKSLPRKWNGQFVTVPPGRRFTTGGNSKNKITKKKKQSKTSNKKKNTFKKKTIKKTRDIFE